MEKTRKGKESNEATAAVDKDLTRTEDADCDSDEDCEIYFLKPVNEYNIVDKIKEANKELFENGADTTNATTSDIENAFSIQGYRRVTFALNLESYEPNNDTNEKNLNLEDEPDSNCTTEVPPTNIKEQNNLEQILEEDMEPAQSPIETIEDIENVTDILLDKDSAEDDIVEEICEEIIVLDMEPQRRASIELDAEEIVEPSEHILSRQATFECDEQEDNKSLVNLLDVNGDDNDDDSTRVKDSLDKVDDDNDDDDDLSIIVASYLPDDYDKTSLVDDSMSSEQMTNTNSQASNSKMEQKRKTSFSFRRKGNNRQNNSNGGFNPFTRARKHRPQSPAEGNDIRMNYRTCCEYRDSTLEQLPKYTGYLSEYGLSREQLEEREQKLQKKQFFVLDKTLKTNERELSKMQDNERAFVKWLKNKMRFPINKTRNMFDVRTKFGVCGKGTKAKSFFTRAHAATKVGEVNSNQQEAANL